MQTTFREFVSHCIRSIALLFNIRASRKIAGARLHFPVGTDIGIQLLFRGGFEKTELDLCERLLTAESTVIDIGANIGVHTVHFAKFCPNGLIIAIEPSTSTFQFLSDNIGGLNNVVALNVALGDDNGIVDFYVAIDNAYSGLKNTGRKQIIRKQKAMCYSVDYLLSPILKTRQVNLVKIDVEGWENQVLHGMQKTLIEHKPVILCEIQRKNSDLDPLATIRFCESLGFRTYIWAENRFAEFKTVDDKFDNYWFVPIDGVDTFLSKAAATRTHRNTNAL